MSADAIRLLGLLAQRAIENETPEEAGFVGCILKAPPSPTTPWPPCGWSALKRSMGSDHAAERAYYVSTMLALPDPSGRLRNRKEQFAAHMMLVLDDVGGKVDANSQPPTYVIETSEGNFQWGYVWETPIPQLEVAEGVVRAVYEAQGLTDSGGKLANKFVRLPAGWNGKQLEEGRNTFQVRLTEFHPDRLYRWEDLLKGWGLEIAPARKHYRRRLAPRETMDALLERCKHDTRAARELAELDPVYAAVREAGLDTSRPEPYQETFRVQMVCPWVDDHTNGDASGTAYIGGGAFVCWHHSCSERRGDALRLWLASELQRPLERGPDRAELALLELAKKMKEASHA
jgi:hypothetical protein